MKMNNNIPPVQNGFSLLEVLVALLVLSFGLLGMAALQSTGLKLNHQSYQRTQVTLLIYDIVDRMRANPQGVTNGNYTLTLATTTPVDPGCLAAACTPAQLADHDRNIWRNAITAATGNTGNSAIETVGALQRITVTWNEQGIPITQTLDVQLQ